MNCFRCYEPIPPARLKAMPETRLCITCSEEVGGDFIFTATLERTNKPGSMKVNYGAVILSKRRRRITRKCCIKQTIGRSRDAAVIIQLQEEDKSCPIYARLSTSTKAS